MPTNGPTDWQRKAGEFTACRTIGHKWNAKNVTTSDHADLCVILGCTRCTTVRADHVQRSGEFVKRRYQYPRGYRDVTPMTRTEWRARFLKGILK